ncbi:LIP-domain-containing protein [Xylariaceae sp. AK1471]|nr:LIP-domain-containing protein [Xylariaceae sp. AK1471]
MQFLTNYLLPLSALLLPAHGRHMVPQQRQAPNDAIPPSQDPWYTAPAGFESASPGTVLRIRPDPSNITAVVSAAAAYNILFRTTDTRYRPSWAVTTFLLPKNPARGNVNSSCNKTNGNGTTASDEKAALLSYQIPYNTADVDGSPSYLLSTVLAQEFMGIPPSTGDIAEALSHGWYVNVPDFEGPLASFAAGLQEGHAVLDSVRAALSSDPFPSTLENTRYAMWGYSGGSIASTFAAELQASYAPELDFAGMAIGGLIPNISAVLSVFPTPLLGLTSQYPEARKFLLSQLKIEGPYNATGFLAALHLDVNKGVLRYLGQDLNEYFVDGLEPVLAAPELARIFGNNGYQGYHGIPQMPVFAYKAIHDDVTTGIATSDEVISRYCGVGANILYHRNSVGGHNDELVDGAPRAREFLAAALDGSFADKYNSTGCTWVDVAVNVTASASSSS